MTAALVTAGGAAYADATGWPLAPNAPVGQHADGSVVVATGQRITPAGQQIPLQGQRPNAIALSPDGHTAAC